MEDFGIRNSLSRARLIAKRRTFAERSFDNLDLHIRVGPFVFASPYSWYIDKDSFLTLAVITSAYGLFICLHIVSKTVRTGLVLALQAAPTHHQIIICIVPFIYIGDTPERKDMIRKRASSWDNAR